MRSLFRSRGRASGGRRPAAPTVTADGQPTRPDKLSIWPTDHDAYGIDVLYLGPQGERRARVVFRQVHDAGVAVVLRREGESGWIVRFGPVEREAMLAVLNGYVW